jgi:two-component system chemotaxis response regulator CheB
MTGNVGKPQPVPGPAGSAGQIRVMVVDDSLVIRGFITRMLREHPEIDVVASISNAPKAIERAKDGDIDVIVLDIEMPEMDGVTALPHLLKAAPGVVIIMASTLTTRNAEISLRALEAGATDYLPKPTSANDLFAATDFKRDLTDKIVALAPRRRAARATASALTPRVLTAPVALRAAGKMAPRVLAIGSSTGGPGALHRVLGDLPKPFPLPVVVTQHMPPMFTRMLAENLSKAHRIDCREAADGDALVPGRVLIAPGDYHMLFRAEPGRGLVVELSRAEKENFCRPAVDPMLRSLVRHMSGYVLCVILTGMGSDGLSGCRTLVEKGGTVLAQDEATSVVWGMPGAVSRAGLCSSVLPLERIGQQVGVMVKGR